MPALSAHVLAVQHSAAGAEPWGTTVAAARTERLWPGSQGLRDAGYRIAATHLTREAVCITQVDWTQQTAFVLGNENDGALQTVHLQSLPSRTGRSSLRLTTSYAVQRPPKSPEWLGWLCCALHALWARWAACAESGPLPAAGFAHKTAQHSLSAKRPAPPPLAGVILCALVVTLVCHLVNHTSRNLS